MIQRLIEPKYFLLLIGLLVFLFQPYKVGFESSHHGWVSAHVLSQASRATPENYFLGYARDHKTDLAVDKVYFDRYPVLFSGATNLILKPFWDHLAQTIYVARQWMNVFFILMSWLVLRACFHLTGSREKAAAVTLFVISGSLFVKYKDMVHFDQPAVVGCLLVLNGIIDYHLHGKTKFLWWGAILGSLLGRGYAVIFFLLAWTGFLFIKEFRISRSLMTALKHTPFKWALLSVPLPALMLMSNIWSESQLRGIPIKDTSIVLSAQHRLGMKSYVSKENIEKKFSWPSFINNQVQRGLDLVTPYAIYGVHLKVYKKPLKHYTTIIPKVIFQLFFLFFVFKLLRSRWRTKSEQFRFLANILIWGGIIWLLVMRNLAAYHDYVSMYLIGMVIVMWIFIIEELEARKLPYLKLALGTFVAGILLNFSRETLTSRKVNWQSREFQKVRTEMKKEGFKTAYLSPDIFTNFIEGVRYGDSFLLSGFNLTYNKKLADVEITKTPDGDGFKLLMHPTEVPSI